MRSLDAPRHMVRSIEGEGPFNDVTALVAYPVAVGAVVADSFSLADANLKLLAAGALPLPARRRLARASSLRPSSS